MRAIRFLRRNSDSRTTSSLAFRLGHEELFIRRYYEVLSIGNDILIAVWFTAGSVLFFSEDTATLGTWMFLIGSIELGIRPIIRMSRHVHLRRVQVHARRESDQDF